MRLKSFDKLFEKDSTMDGGLIDLLKTMFKNININAEISSKNEDITIFIVMKEKEKLSGLISIFDVIKKIKKDILIQYDSEFEMWETKSGYPYLFFSFFYEGDYSYEGDIEDDFE